MSDPLRFQIFRAADAHRMGEEGVLTTDPTPVQAEGLARMLEAGAIDGAEFRVLCDLPGFTLIHAWFKPGYPLPLHSHSADCLYHVTAGAARMGTEDIAAGDSFMVPANTPYTFHAGPAGVEILEFRHTLVDVDFRNYAKNRAFYDKAVAAILAHRAGWQGMARPSAG